MKTLNVLLVEDNDADVMFFRETIRDIKGHGVALEVANELAGAIEIAKEIEFDVIFLDLGLPDCIGIETFDRMIKEVNSTPIVVFTGSEGQDGGVGVVQRGAQDFLVKGFVSGDLLEKTMLYAVERFKYELIRQELEQARVELATIANTKSRFLSNVSHELSTPLTATMGYLQILSGSAGLSDANRSTAVKALDASRKLHGVITNIIEAARIEMEGVSVTDDQVQVSYEIQRLIERFKPLCDAKEIVLNVFYSELDGFIMDQAKLRFVMNALLENAVRFTNAGTIELHLARSDQNIRLCVKDTGSGIAPSLQPRLFDSFQHDIDYLLTEGRGAGLSLYICKSYVNAMGGDMKVESDGALGSLFTAVIPAGIKDETMVRRIQHTAESA